MQQGDQVYIDRPQQKMQHTENILTDLLTEQSDNLETAIAIGRSEVLFRTTGPYKLQSATDSAAFIDKNGEDVAVSLNRSFDTF